jgi:hypothetical protein
LPTALDAAPDALFARTGAMRIDAIRLRTELILLRLRYTLEEEVEEFAEKRARRLRAPRGAPALARTARNGRPRDRRGGAPGQ